jgi:hypothetical protein
MTVERVIQRGIMSFPHLVAKLLNSGAVSLWGSN